MEDWEPGRWSGRIWTATATSSAPITATSSGTTCPRDLQELTPREFYINYSHEATFGEELRLVGFRNPDGSYLMEGVGPMPACFTALCVF